MAVEEVVSPRSSDLLALAQAKTLLKIETADTSQDALLRLLITAVSSTIQDTVLGFPLGRRQVLETLPGTPRTHLILSCLPIDPDSLTIQVDNIEQADFQLDPETGIAKRRDGWGGTVYPNWWLGTSGWSTGNQRVVGEDPIDNIAASYVGGYLLPNDVGDWSASTVYEAGAWVRLGAASPLRLECTTAGTSGTGAPVYPAAGLTVADGSVTWTARRAWEMPACFVMWAHAELLRVFGRPGNLSFDVGALDSEGTRISFLVSQMASTLSPHVMQGVLTWRQGRGGIA